MVKTANDNLNYKLLTTKKGNPFTARYEFKNNGSSSVLDLEEEGFELSEMEKIADKYYDANAEKIYRDNESMNFSSEYLSFSPIKRVQYVNLEGFDTVNNIAQKIRTLEKH